ncbi:MULTISPECIES: hypothetical protein [Xenorhabdus]|uniref:Non ribosomal peptide synthetase BasB n=1 Tax=Xenorhabdus ehlersii TaxID=290111 RepID=A0A2D0IYQ2_9GAMM|nr:MULTISPECIES: hypothetical protein [Xenorhabdus]MBC8947806.1 non ribosomal peptide synthetase BasB [Xenorhabdus sp. TS4]MBC8948792.1 non ribosomal peptide synthetase BasB [Xenorhabdus sp. TS4]PHM25308.1 non ribosomal peptide synthetase BasB [Xenorhabdus ehlersii]PHM26885.1 non ribosomal peptide synthetase BasB [Xenorhabdus ehlersii]
MLNIDSGKLSHVSDNRKTIAAHEKDTRDTINNSMPYADVPFDLIQQSLGMTPENDLIFDVYIQIHANNVLNDALKTPPGSDIRYWQIDSDKKASMFGLKFEIMEDVNEPPIMDVIRSGAVCYLTEPYNPTPL